MLKTILVPLDGSPLAERALPFARRLAHASGARLNLIRVADHFEERLAGDEEAQTYLDVLFAGLAEAGLTGETQVLASRHHPANAIVDRSHGHADLVVMATHGRSGLGRAIYGSVAEDVLRQAEVPVLMVPPTGQPLWPTEGTLRILVPLDGSTFAEEILTPAVSLAKALGAELRLLRIVEPVYPLNPELTAYSTTRAEAELAEAQAYLESVSSKLVPAGVAMTARAVMGVPAPTLMAVAAEESVSVIAMATHGRTGLARIVIGSVATSVLRQTKVPMLLARPTGVRQRVRRGD